MFNSYSESEDHLKFPGSLQLDWYGRQNMLLFTYGLFEECLSAHKKLGKGQEQVMSSAEVQFSK